MLNFFKRLKAYAFPQKKFNKTGHFKRLELLALEERVVPATFTVVNNLDSGTGSLRQAIIDANASSNNDIIDFSFGSGSSPFTITLASALPNIAATSTAGTLTINGLGANNLIIDANQGNFSIFTINSGGDLSISGVKVTGANTSGAGGAFNNSGTLAVSSSAISANTANNGGGISNSGTISVSNSTLSSNTALGGFGGGIFSFGGNLTVSNSTISDNTSFNGGGILNTGSGTGTVTNTTLSGNTANNGGGIFNDSTLTVTNSTLSGNSATSGGGIFNDNAGAINIANTIIANSSSGGNFAGTGTVNLIGSATAANNLVSQGSFSWATTKTSSEINLGPLQDNGGPTFTHALLAGSIAIGTGNATISNASPIFGLDQRGYVRSSSTPSIGAYEFNGIAPSPANDFTFNSSTGVITGYTGPGGAVVIPGTIGGVAVVGIGDNAFANNATVTSIVIPNSVTSIGVLAFQGVTGLTNLVIPNSVTSLGTNAFQSCSGLTGITISSSLTSIALGAFNGCSGLISVVIPNSVTSIGAAAFSGCHGLVSILIPNSVTSIGAEAFANCFDLTDILIPNGVTTIGNFTFINNFSLTSVVIPNSVTSIGAQAFQNATGLTSVTIGNSVASIGTNAFNDCTSLNSLYFYGNAPSTSTSSFANVPGTIYYLQGATGWSNPFSNNNIPTVAVSTPTVNLNTGGLSINATTLTITGTNFVPTPSLNTVSFSSGTGHVTSATSTQLTVTFDTAPSLGSLTAVVTSFGGNSGNPVQAANIVNPPNNPTFGATIGTADGFTVPITNFDANFTYAANVTANGTVAISNTGLVVVTGVAANTSCTATVSTSRANYADGSAQVTATSLNAANNPTFGTPVPTADGFTVQITNYNAAFTYGGTATVGSVSVDGSGLVTVTGVSPNTSSTATITTTQPGYADGSTQVTATSLDAANTPTFGTPVPTADGFTVQITNFNGAFTYSATVTAGSVSISGTGLVSVTGVSSGASSTATITTTQTGYADGSAQVTATSLNAANNPTFGTPVPTADGFTVQITNFDANFTYAANVTANGTVAISNTGLVVVTGVAANTSCTVTVTTSRANYANGSAQVTATSLNVANTPAFGTPVPTADGFTVQITNYNAAFTYGGTATVGSVSVDGSGLVTVTGVSPNTSSTVTITTTQTGYASGSAQVTATSLNVANNPTFGTPVPTADGFTVQITNFNGAFTYSATVTAGSVSISGTGLVSVTGVSSGTSSTATITTTQAGYADGSAQVDATSLIAANNPTFGTPVPTADGFTVQITNFDPAFTYAANVTANGTVAISNTGLVVVTGVAANTSCTVTVTTFRANYADGSAQVTATSLNVANNPTFGTPVPTADGFTVQITNYNGTFTYGGTATAGSVSISGIGLVSVTGVSPNTSSTATITTTQTNYVSGSAQVTATSLLAANIPTFGTPTPTADGFTVQITNYNAAFTYAGTATIGSVSISGTGLVSVTGVSPNTSSTATITTTQTGYASGSAQVTATAQVTAPLVTGTQGSSSGGSSTVTLYDPATGQPTGTAVPFPGFNGPVKVVSGDLNNDGVADIIAGAGFGGGPAIAILDSQTGEVIEAFFAFDPAFTGGVFVAVQDVNSDGILDIIASAGLGGGPEVRIFDGTNLSLLRSFFAYDQSFTGGVSVASVDLNNDGTLDLVTGAGPGGGPHVKVFDGATGNIISQWFAYPISFTGGVFVAAGDIGNDGTIEVVTGAGAGGAPVVAVWDPFTGALLAQFMAYAEDFTGGVRVGINDGNTDGIADILTGAGPGGGPQVNVFDFPGLNLLLSFYSGDPANTGGVYVG